MGIPTRLHTLERTTADCVIWLPLVRQGSRPDDAVRQRKQKILTLSVRPPSGSRNMAPRLRVGAFCREKGRRWRRSGGGTPHQLLGWPVAVRGWRESPRCWLFGFTDGQGSQRISYLTTAKRRPNISSSPRWATAWSGCWRCDNATIWMRGSLTTNRLMRSRPPMPGRRQPTTATCG